MIFKFKKPVITIDAFTYDEGTRIEVAPKPTSKFIPKEFKRLPNKIPSMNNNIIIEQATLKGCTGVLNLFTTGFIIPAWCDFNVQVDAGGSYQWNGAHRTLDVSDHPPQQLWEGFYPKHSHIKLHNPWVFREKTGVNFTWQGCIWHNYAHDNMVILPAVLDFKYQATTHVNMMIKHDSQLSMKAGDPLVQLIPVSDKKVEIKTHRVSYEEWDSMRFNPVRWTDTYKLRKKAIDESERKCPFGFGK